MPAVHSQGRFRRLSRSYRFSSTDDMQLSTVDKLLEVQGYDLEVIAVTPDGKRFKVGGFGSV